MDRMMKYIIFADKMGPDTVIIFSAIIEHVTMASALDIDNDSIVSAGFVELDANTIRCCGRSSSLGKVSRGDTDAQIIRTHLQPE